jgi:hypothetical protein
MESKKLLTAIVALLIVASIASISTISVSAVHDESPSIDKSTLAGSTPMIRTITVNHTSGSPIDNVRIILPTALTSAVTSVKNVPENDNVIPYGDNWVVLPAGTAVQLLANETVILAENTHIIVPENKYVYWGVNNGQTKLQENARVETMKSPSATANNIPAGDNIEMAIDENVYLENNNLLRLVADTLVMYENDNIMRLPEDTTLELVATNDNGINALENVMNKEDVVAVMNDNHVRLLVDNVRNSMNWSILTGDNVELTDNVIDIPAGTTVQLSTTVRVRIPENTEVVRESGKDIDISGTDVENVPNNWMQSKGSSTLPPGNYVEWVGIGENQIKDSPLDFPIGFTTTALGDNYTIWVQTTDTTGAQVQRSIIVSIDNVAPTVTITALPTWAKDNTAVAITVTASEAIVGLENAWVAENNAPENTAVPLTSNDNITWTGTYTTTDNSKRDGTAIIYVLGSQYEDSVGNEGTDNTSTFTIDRMVPPTPQLTAITGLPTTPTNVGGWLIQGIAQDNFLGGLTVQKGMTVNVRVGTTITAVTTDATGYFSASITLNQGEQEIGIQYIDKAGNVGKENAENITYDSIAPVITPGTISGKTLADGVIINDNTPTVKLTFTDATLGIENAAFDNTDNSGYSVQLWDENDSVIATLINATPPAENMPTTISFENTYPTALADGTYSIYAVAGDNLQMDNLVISFVIDTVSPAAPTLTTQASSSALNPTTPTTTTISVGGTAEPDATIRIWTSPYPFTSQTNVENVVAGMDGTWTASITIDQGVIVWIGMSQVDTAGNESATKAIYGYLRVDISAPVVTITSPATGTKTDKSTITVSGNVTKDAWETYSTDITLSLQNGVTSTSIVIPIQNDGTFSVNVTLSEGKNSIIATARDAAGNSSSDTVTVERTVTSWAIYAIILVIIALILAAIAIFRMR